MTIFRGWRRAIALVTLWTRGLAAAGEAVPAAPEADPDASWADKVVVIELHGPILGEPFGQVPQQVDSALGKAERDGARVVVFDIDSPGGEVGACDAISNRILQLKIPSVAFVAHKAVSGGAMVALACEEIVMAVGSRLGDIQPMAMGPGGGYAEMDARTAEKIEADIRTQLKTVAEARKKRPIPLLEAMVSADMEITRVAFRDGTFEYLTRPQLDLLEKNIREDLDSRVVAGKELVTPAGKLLHLAPEEAVKYGVADATAADRDGFFAHKGWSESDRVAARMDKAEIDLKKLLPDMPGWAHMLLLVFLVVAVAGLWLEMQTPGFGIPGTAGFIGVVGFFAILMMHDRGSWLAIALFIVGAAMLLVEILVLPGFGMVGVGGILLILAGLFLAYAPDLTTPVGSAYFSQRRWDLLGDFVLMVFGGLAGGGLLIWLALAYGERIPIFSKMFMPESLRSGREVWETLRTASEKDPAGARSDGTDRIGRAGTAKTPLRPAGKVALDGDSQLVDAFTTGEWIDVGARIRVVGAEFGQVVVAPEA